MEMVFDDLASTHAQQWTIGLELNDDPFPLNPESVDVLVVRE